MEDGKRICRILLNILIPSAGIVLVCVLPLSNILLG